jgi:hypothetical protein
VNNQSCALVFLIDGAHERSRWRQHLIDEYKDCLLGREFDPFADNIDKLSDRQVLDKG